MGDDPNRRFWIGFTAFFLLWLLYPFALGLSLPFEHFGYYYLIELSWSFAAMIFLPVGCGLFAASLDRTLLVRIRGPRAIFFLFVPAIAGLVLIFFGVQTDIDGIPNPDRISVAAKPSFQSAMVEYDQCLRMQSIDDCPSPSGLPSNTRLQCANANTRDLDRRVFPRSAAGNTVAEPFRKKLAYYCEMRAQLKQSGLADSGSILDVVARTPVAWVAVFLNFLFVGSIWLTICWMTFLASTGFRSVKVKTVYIFASWVAILSIWFPIRLYSEWQWWYGDLSHVYLAYHALLFLAAVAFAMVLFIAVWIFVGTGSDLVATLKGVYGLAGILLASSALFFGQTASEVFRLLSAAPVTLVLLLGLVMLMILTAYVSNILQQLNES